MRIFLDAKILFSAAKSEEAVRRLLELLLDAGYDPSFSTSPYNTPCVK
jgi:hypothetical protein